MPNPSRQVAPGQVHYDAVCYLMQQHPDAARPQPYTERGREIREAIRILESLMYLCDHTWCGEWVTLEPRGNEEE